MIKFHFHNKIQFLILSFQSFLLQPPTRRSLKRGGGGGGESTDLCENCQEKVFLMQKVNVEGHLFHRSCFKCNKCRLTLQSKVYEYDSEVDKFYCRQHYREVTRQKSIKRTMAARGIKAFDESDLPKKQKMGDGGGNVKKNETDGSPQVPRALSPPAATSEGQIKQSLPSLLSSLAAQKKKQQSEAGKEEGGGGGRGVVPPAKPPTGRAPPMLKSSVSSPTIVKPLSRPSPPPPFHKPSVSSAKPPPTRTHPKPYSPTGSKPTTNAATKPMPPSSSPSSKPASSTSNSKFWVGNGKSDVTTTAAGVKRETETKGPGNTTTTNEDRAKDTVSPPRQSVGAWWKQREKDQKEITPKKMQLKQTKSSPPPPTDPSEPTEYLIPSKVINPPTQSDTPPTQSGNPVAQSDLNRATVLMHYEFGPSHFANNKGAQKVLEDHYEFKPKDLPDPDPSPYEVPQKSQPTKPPRMKRKGAAKDEPHPPRNSETWKNPYAMTPLKNDEEYDVIGAGRGRSPKPPRPAPPPPFVSKARKKSLISPYAVSSVAEESPIRGKILIIWKWQLEVIILSIHFD